MCIKIDILNCLNQTEIHPEHNFMRMVTPSGSLRFTLSDLKPQSNVISVDVWVSEEDITALVCTLVAKLLTVGENEPNMDDSHKGEAEALREELIQRGRKRKWCPGRHWIRAGPIHREYMQLLVRNAQVDAWAVPDVRRITND